jgi:hypothetical protein
MKRTEHAMLAVALVAILGCQGGPGRLSPPEIDAAEAAVAAMALLDANHDGQLNDEELKASPALVEAKARYDADASGSLSQEEIAGGIRKWTEGTTGAVSVPFVVQFNGRPLAGAEVKLTPEPFLGAAAKSALSETRRDVGYLTLAPEDRPANAPNIPLMMPGLYRVAITHPTVSIPAKYNVETTLGIEVAKDTIGTSGVMWNLSSK